MGGGSRRNYSALNEPIRKLITPFDRNQLVAVSNRLYANDGVFRGAIDDKGLQTTRDAFRPIFRGKDKDWGREAIRWLEDWFKQCEDGAEISFHDGIYMESVAVDRDGDVGVVPTRSRDGYPLIRHIPGHRIGQRNWNWGNIEGQGMLIPDGEPYAGNWLYDGVVLNYWGRPRAYKIKGTTPDRDYYIPVKNLTLLKEPIWFDQVRGYPLFFHALNDFRDMKQSKDAELRAQLMAGTRTLIEYNETGAPPNPADPTQYHAQPATTAYTPTDATQTAGPAMEVLHDNQTTYFTSGTGGKLEMLENNRPSDNYREFMDRTRRGAMAGQTMPDPLVFDLQGMPTNAIRLLLDKLQIAKDDRYELLYEAQLTKIRHAIVGAMDLGLLTFNEEWYMWGFSGPKDSTIDKGREGKQLIEDFKIGFITQREVLQRTTGQTVEEFWDEKFDELAIKHKARAAAEARHKVRFDNREVQMFSPNDQSEEAIEEETEEPEGADDE